MKIVAIVGLAVLAVLFAVAAFGPLRNLWGYRDGAIATYLLFGLPPLFLSLASIAAIVVVARR